MPEPFSETVRRCAIRLDPAGRDRAALIAELVGAAGDAVGWTAARQQEVVEAVLRREASDSTALPGGVFLPHARIEGLDHVEVAFGVLRAGVNLEAPDGELTRFVVLLLAPANNGNGYAHALARFSRIVADPAMRQRLLAAGSIDEIRATLAS